MTERISIFNYEAYYLDYLEGNLNEEDTALLMEFLEQNPSLKLEDETLVTFDEEEIKLNDSIKKELIQPSLEDEISDKNVEFFMISSVEGLIDKEKEKELNEFIATREELQKEARFYKNVIVEPDLSMKYASKEDLKRKEVTLWPYISAVAAASVIYFVFMFTPIGNETAITNGKVLAGEKGIKKFTIEEAVTGIQEVTNSNPLETQVASIQSNDFQTTGVNTENRKHAIDYIPKKSPTVLLSSMNDKKLEPIAKKTFDPSGDIPKSFDNTVASANTMVNPIKPITQFVSEKTNTEVDFGRSKKTEDKKGGFFLKIGKFEISRNKN